MKKLVLTKDTVKNIKIKSNIKAGITSKGGNTKNGDGGSTGVAQ
jgi:hypothetical protein